MVESVPVRFATPADAPSAAQLLWDFNTEFDAATPPVAELATRLEQLLATDTTLAILGGEPAVAIGLVTLRNNVWFTGPVALLDELYVAPAHRDRGIGTAIIQALLERASADGWGLVEVNVDEFDADARRFYERHGFANTEPDSDERAPYYWRTIGA
jgi:GNAT superfamily N-acetyltransferase